MRRLAFEAAVGLFIVFTAVVVIEICWLAPRLGVA